MMDWKDASAYRDDLSDWQWRWQFLRRSPEYRKDWEHYQNDPDSITPEKYRLYLFTDPDMTCPDNLSIMPTFAHSEAILPGQMVIDPDKGLYVAPIYFDLTDSLDAQWERAKSQLKHLQKQIDPPTKRRRDKTKMVKYLRVLDAKKAGASLEEIFQELEGHKDGYNNNSRARANKLIKAAQKFTYDIV